MTDINKMAERETELENLHTFNLTLEDEDVRKNAKLQQEK